MAERAHPIQVEQVGPTGIYPASGPLPPGDAEVRGQGELAHPEERQEIRRVTHQQTGQRAALLTGRALLGGLFVLSGSMLVLGGLSLMTGVKPKVGARLGSAALAAFPAKGG